MTRSHDCRRLLTATLAGWMALGVAWPSMAAEATSPTLSSDATAAPWKDFDARRAFGYLRRQTEFGPRAPGSPAAAQCLDWMESQFQELGLETRRQTFPA